MIFYGRAEWRVVYGICSVSQKLELLGENWCYFWNQQVKYTQKQVLTFEAPKCVLASAIFCLPFQHETWTNLDEFSDRPSSTIWYNIWRKIMYYIIKLYPKLSAISISSALFHILFLGVQCCWIFWLSSHELVISIAGWEKVYFKDIHTAAFQYVISKGSHFYFSSDQFIILNHP
jgi:hypothetical protein